MIWVMPVLLALFAFALQFIAPDRQRRIEGTPALAAWFGVSMLWTLSIIAGFSIGLYIMPIPVVLTALLIWARPPARSTLGLVFGAGLLVLMLGLLNLVGNQPCEDTGRIVDGAVVYGSGFDGSETSCSDFNAVPWIITGGAALVAGAVPFVLTQRRTGSEAMEKPAP